MGMKELPRTLKQALTDPENSSVSGIRASVANRRESDRLRENMREIDEEVAQERQRRASKAMYDDAKKSSEPDKYAAGGTVRGWGKARGARKAKIV